MMLKEINHTSKQRRALCASVHTVKLGQNDSGGPAAATGHIYRYFGNGPVGKFAGEARPLIVTLRAESDPKTGNRTSENAAKNTLKTA
jgi:hypothetical protein